MNIITEITKNTNLSQIGGKASQLTFLLSQEVAVPKSWAVPWPVFERFVAGDTAVLPQLQQAIETTLDETRPYAVRSSANVEDGGNYSFAGQFESVLDVTGAEAILEAIQTVWQSARREGLRPYLEAAGMTRDDIKMAVLIQEMVTPAVSGVAFSKNPMTGTDETIVEAVQGSGERLMQEGVTPQRWVHKWGKWMAESDALDIPLTLIQTVVDETKQLAKAFGAPIDLEWVWDGTAVHWVQIREITTLKNLNVYSNRISREVMPGIIKPLIWSVNVPLVNSAWVDLITELIGPHDIKAEELAHSFHYRSYFNISTLGRVFTALGMPTETLELMMGLEGGDEKPRFKPSGQTYRHMPRMIRFGIDKLRFARKIEAFLPEAAGVYGRIAQKELTSLTAQQLLDEIDALFAFTKRMAYVNVVGPLLMTVHNNRFQKQLEKMGGDYASLDLMRDVPDLEKYDPSSHLDALAEQFTSLDEKTQVQVREASAAQFAQIAGIDKFRNGLNRFMDRFGHFSDSGNDFSAVPWREQEGFVRRMVAHHTRLDTAERKQAWETIPLSGWQRQRLNGSFKRARRFRAYRERISYNYTYGYNLFRKFFFALAERLQDRGLLNERDDIFYLYWDEVRQLVANETAVSPQPLIQQRRDEIEAVRDYILPEIVYGDDPPPPETAVDAQDQLNGIPTSRGYYRGPVRVIQSVREFDKMVPGAVIVIPFSDVSWTPLFGKAGAVIAESGGMLSHSSIVAREYNLPAVVSVTNACRILQDDAEVSVDGFKGTVTVTP